MPKKIDIAGNKYGLLTVLEDSGERNNKKAILWKCQCECGNICLKTKESLERVSKKPKACSTECQNGIKINDIFNYLTVIDIISVTGDETQYK